MVKIEKHIFLEQRIKCNLDLEYVSRETGISAKQIKALEMSDRKPFSSVLSYKMAEKKLGSYYEIKLSSAQQETKIPRFLRSKING